MRVYVYNSLLFFLQFLFLCFDAFGVLSTLKRFKVALTTPHYLYCIENTPPPRWLLFRRLRDGVGVRTPPTRRMKKKRSVVVVVVVLSSLRGESISGVETTMVAVTSCRSDGVNLREGRTRLRGTRDGRLRVICCTSEGPRRRKKTTTTSRGSILRRRSKRAGRTRTS